MLRYLLLLTSILLHISCAKQEQSSRNLDEENLRIRYNTLVEYTNTACDAAHEWTFVAVGEKACGGPKGYLPYPKNVDNERFLNLVKEYNEAEKSFNIKYRIVSDCMYMMPPDEVICEGGKPKLIYKNM